MAHLADENRGGGDAVRAALIATFRRIMRLYFRDIERIGMAPGADVRGRVFVSNHGNALIDPVLVLTDAACDISPIAKSTLWKVPGLSWLLDRAGAVPIVRRKDAPDKAAGANDDAFDKIAAHLGGGGNILIFPEGTSHSEPQLAPLRTGAARMMLAAEQEGGVPPTFQAAALEFDERDTFRSRCLVLWGPVRRFADVAGADDEARVKAATALMDADLRELLVEGDTHEDRARIARVAEMLANDEDGPSLQARAVGNVPAMAAWNEAGRKVELATKTLRGTDPAVVASVIEALDAYYRELERLGVRDAQVVDGAGDAGASGTGAHGASGANANGSGGATGARGGATGANGANANGSSGANGANGANANGSSGANGANGANANGSSGAAGARGRGNGATGGRLQGRWRELAKAPLAASGFALYALPYFVPRMVAKTTDTDAVSTIKLGAALVVYPVWMAGLVGASFAFLPPPLSLMAAAIAVSSPFAALKWLDAYYQRSREPTAAELGHLVDLRRAATTAIAGARAKL